MENKQSSWKNHEHDPMEQMRRAFLSEIKGLKKEIDLLKLQIQINKRKCNSRCSFNI